MLTSCRTGARMAKYPPGYLYSCNMTAYFKLPEALATVRALRSIFGAGRTTLPRTLTLVDDYKIHKMDEFSDALESINSKRVLVKPGRTSLHNPGDRLINKIVKAKQTPPH